MQDFKLNVIKPIKSQEKIGREKFEVMHTIMGNGRQQGWQSYRNAECEVKKEK